MDTTAVVVGGGPAGMMTGLLLARQGIEVVVLEKHADFLRDFRGDTIHPSTLQVVHELGWLDELLQLPHSEMRQVTVRVGHEEITFADFSELPVAAKFIAFLPQWDFLDFLASKASDYPNFRLLRSAAVTDVVWKEGRAVGVRLGPGAPVNEIRAAVVIAADGRHSTIRQAAGLHGHTSAPPVDIFWFRLPRIPEQRVPFFRGGQGALVSIDRGDYWQVAYTLPAGAGDAIRRAGLNHFHDRIRRIEPNFADALATLSSWNDVHQLTVRVDRLHRWHRPALLCIGDAAHAMSPAGGVGINLAIQDAVATANIVGPALSAPHRAAAIDRTLAAVQRRRKWPTRITQFYQLRVLKGLYPQNLEDDTATHLPLIFRLFRRFGTLRHLGGRFIGLGALPEHVQPKGRQGPLT